MNKSATASDIQIIQLAESGGQRGGSTNYENGHFDVTLNSKIVVEEGDQISLRNAFIDIQTDATGVITVKSDYELTGSGSKTTTTIGMDYGWYVRDYFNTFPVAADDANGVLSKTYTNQTSLAVQNTGDIFVPQLGTPAATQDNTVRYLSSKFQFNPNASETNTLVTEVEWYINNPKAGGDPIEQHANLMIDMYEPDGTNNGFFDTEFVTTDEAGRSFITVNQSLIDKGWTNKSNTFIFPKDANGNHIGIPCIDDSTSIGDKLMFFSKDKNNWVPANAQTKDVLSTGMGDKLSAAPVGSINFSIESKDYEPSELAQIISTNFENAPPSQSGSAFELTTNNMLTNTQLLKVENTPAGGVPTKMPFVNLAGTQEFIYNDTFPTGGNVAYNVGSSQFGLTFDQDSSKFELGSIHTSRYDSNGNAVVEGFINGNNEKRIMTNYSGIFIKQLRPKSLWIGDENDANCMRFAPSIITTETTVKMTVTGGVADQTAHVPLNLTEGVNITADLATLDSLVLKKSTADAGNQSGKAYDIALQFASFPPYRDAISQVNGIFSQSAVDPAKQGNLGGGYYLVEIDMGIKQEFKSSKIHNNKIRGIVSRYYNNANYISSGEESGIIYEHKGEPVEISRLKVRILNPDGKLATDINDASTIFLNYLTKK